MRSPYFLLSNISNSVHWILIISICLRPFVINLTCLISESDNVLDSQVEISNNHLQTNGQPDKLQTEPQVDPPGTGLQPKRFHLQTEFSPMQFVISSIFLNQTSRGRTNSPAISRWKRRIEQKPYVPRVGPAASLQNSCRNFFCKLRSLKEIQENSILRCWSQDCEFQSIQYLFGLHLLTSQRSPEPPLFFAFLHNLTTS